MPPTEDPGATLDLEMAAKRIYGHVRASDFDDVHPEICVYGFVVNAVLEEVGGFNKSLRDYNADLTTHTHSEQQITINRAGCTGRVVVQEKKGLSSASKVSAGWTFWLYRLAKSRAAMSKIL